MANVYLKITDLHDKESGFEGRIDYNAEMSVVWQKITETVMKYKEDGHNVFLIFTGDIHHNSYKDAVQAIRGNNRMFALRLMVDGMYSAVGNHETQYYVNNPFWTYFTKMDSARMRKLTKRMWQPQGNTNILEIPDEVVDGNVRFLFNHYDTPIIAAPTDGKTNIGIFHKDLYAKEIVDEMASSMGLDVFEHNPVYFNNSTVLYGYDYAFFGHMHKMYGKWDYVCSKTGYKTRLHYLASLGRTNHTEVQNNFLERNIPAVIVKNGELEGIEDNKFNLLPREECVKEDLIIKQQEARKIVKEKREFAEYRRVSEDPINNLRATMASNTLLLKIFNELVESGHSSVEDQLLRELEEIRKL